MFKVICFSIIEAPLEIAKTGANIPWEWSDKPTLNFNFFLNSVITFIFKSSNGVGYSYAGNTGGSYSFTFSAATWYYIATVMDSGTTRHYVNGAQVATRTYASSVASTTTVMIGAINNQHEVDGSIPITRIYNKTLTASEVIQNYNAQKSRFGT